MPRPKGKTDLAAIRSGILDAAQAAFAENGFHATSVNAIAKAAGMRGPSLLYHFPSKEVLFEEVMRRAYQEIDDELAQVGPLDGSAADVFKVLVERLLAFEQRHGNLLAVINAEIMNPGAMGVRALRDTMIPALARIETVLRSASGTNIHPDAPIRSFLLHGLAAHAVRSNLSELGSDFWGSMEQEEALFLMLFRTLLDWQPESGDP